MARTAVVATGYGEHQPVDVPAVAGSVRALVADDWSVVVSTIDDGAARSLTLALGQSRSGRRAVPVITHTLVDPADPAFAHPPATCSPQPLAVLEAEGIAALHRSGFAVVATGGFPVVPFGEDYRSVTAALDGAASAQRLAGDLGASVLVFVVADDGPLFSVDHPAGEIDVIEAERRLAGEPRLASELGAAARFLRAGGELAAITTPAFLGAALSPGGISGRPGYPGDTPGPPGEGPADGAGLVHIRRRLVRPRSDAPALAAGWC